MKLKENHSKQYINQLIASNRNLEERISLEVATLTKIRLDAKGFEKGMIVEKLSNELEKGEANLLRKENAILVIIS